MDQVLLKIIQNFFSSTCIKHFTWHPCDTLYMSLYITLDVHMYSRQVWWKTVWLLINSEYILEKVNRIQSSYMLMSFSAHWSEAHLIKDVVCSLSQNLNGNVTSIFFSKCIVQKYNEKHDPFNRYNYGHVVLIYSSTHAKQCMQALLFSMDTINKVQCVKWHNSKILPPFLLLASHYQSMNS